MKLSSCDHILQKTWHATQHTCMLRLNYSTTNFKIW